MLELLDLQKPLLNTRTMRLLIFILAFSATSLFAGQPDSLKTKKWAVGITYSPDYCFRVPYSGKTEAFATNTEKAKIGFTTGLQYGILDAPTFKMTDDDRIKVGNIAQQNLGLLGGVDANYFMTKSTILSIGVRAAYAQDLNRVLTPNPVSNLNVGIRGGITYRLNQK